MHRHVSLRQERPGWWCPLGSLHFCPGHKVFRLPTVSHGHRTNLTILSLKKLISPQHRGSFPHALQSVSRDRSSYPGTRLTRGKVKLRVPGQWSVVRGQLVNDQLSYFFG